LVLPSCDEMRITQFANRRDPGLWRGNPVHWFDISVGIALLIGGVWSFFRGLTREILSIVGMVAAFVLSIRGYPYAAEHLETFITSAWLRQTAGFGLIFLTTMVLYALFAILMHRLVKAAGLSLLDRLLGSLFGFIKVGVMISALLLVTTQFFPTFATRLTARSILAPTFFRTAHILSTLLPVSTSAVFHQVYRRLQRQFPALPSTSIPMPLPSNPPETTPPPMPSHSPDGISKHDAEMLEKILRERLQEP
jgi:membrane protein required for colicin V production